MLAVLGLISLLRQDLAEARTRFEECIRIARRLGDDWLLMLPLRNLGIVALRQEDFAEAERLLKEGLDGLRKLEERWFIASTMEYLAEATALGRDPARAARLFGAAEAMRESVRSFSEPHDSTNYDRGVAAARKELGEAVFDAAWDEGRGMSYGEAISFALGERTPPA